MTPWKLQPVAKYEYYDPDKSTREDQESIITAGLNFFLNDFTRLQFNYRFLKEAEKKIDNDEILFQAQVIF